MTVISLSEVKTAFSKFVNRAAYGQERIVVTSHGQPKAALISIHDLQRLEEFENSLVTHEAPTQYASDGAIALAELKVALPESVGGSAS